jgi:hypothetical protein
MGHEVLWLSRNSNSAMRRSSTLPRRRAQRRFSVRVRMKRSAQPFPTGVRTQAGEFVIPGQHGSF